MILGLRHARIVYCWIISVVAGILFFDTPPGCRVFFSCCETRPASGVLSFHVGAFYKSVKSKPSSLGKGFGVDLELTLEHYPSGMTTIHSLIVNKAKVATDAAH